MGIFDAPAPALSWIDYQASAILPPLPRLILWGIIGAVVSMLLYRALSPQDRIARDKREIREARRDLDNFDGDFADAFPMIRRLLVLSLRQVGRVGWPAVVASLPLLFLLSWLSSAYGYQYPPPGNSPEIRTTPGDLHASWQSHSSGRNPSIVVTDTDRQVVAEVDLSVPVPVIHKRRWWNFLISNPVGYLPENSDVNRIDISLPRKQFVPFGPDWMKGWEAAFFLTLVLASIIIKVVARIE